MSFWLLYRNPRLAIYKFPLIKTDAEKEREMDLIASQQVISAKQQSKVKEVTRDLVEWGAQLVSVYLNHGNVYLQWITSSSHVYTGYV